MRAGDATTCVQALFTHCATVPDGVTTFDVDAHVSISGDGRAGRGTRHSMQDGLLGRARRIDASRGVVVAPQVYEMPRDVAAPTATATKYQRTSLTTPGFALAALRAASGGTANRSHRTGHQTAAADAPAATPQPAPESECAAEAALAPPTVTTRGKKENTKPQSSGRAGGTARSSLSGNGNRRRTTVLEQLSLSRLDAMDSTRSWYNPSASVCSDVEAAIAVGPRESIMSRASSIGSGNPYRVMTASLREARCVCPTLCR